MKKAIKDKYLHVKMIKQERTSVDDKATSAGFSSASAYVRHLIFNDKKRK